MTVICSRCGFANNLELAVALNDSLCGNCYGPIDEAQEKQADLYAAELKKPHPLTKSYGNKND